MDERRDDWRRGVDENLAGLNAGMRVWERDLGDIRRMLGEIDRLLRGDPERETSGILGRIEEAERRTARLDAVIFQDSTGKHGLLHEVEQLTSGERTMGERWKFATAVTVAIISLGGLLLTNWDRVIGFLNREPVPFELADAPKKHTSRHKSVDLPG